MSSVNPAVHLTETTRPALRSLVLGLRPRRAQKILAQPYDTQSAPGSAEHDTPHAVRPEDETPERDRGHP